MKEPDISTALVNVIEEKNSVIDTKNLSKEQIKPIKKSESVKDKKNNDKCFIL